MDHFIFACEQAAPRLAQIGQWPVWIDARASLVDRIPSGDKKASGFDAGLACALDFIPRDKQGLAATLHAAYTEAAVEQVRREIADLDADSETAWWLAACSICKEDSGVNASEFAEQVDQFSRLAGDSCARLDAAHRELDGMKKRFRVLVDGTPFVIRDGGLQAAYIAGYEWGVQYAETYGIFFIGTFRLTLGLENFAFSDLKDGDGRPMSGPVHGSRQFVKTATVDELARALAIVRQTLT